MGSKGKKKKASAIKSKTKEEQQAQKQQSEAQLFYAFGLSDDEYKWFLNDELVGDLDMLIKILRILVNTQRPSRNDTKNIAFIIHERNPHNNELVFFIMILSPKLKKYEMFIVDGKDDRFLQLKEGLTKYPLDSEIALRNLAKYNMKDEFIKIRDNYYHATRPKQKHDTQQRKQREPDWQILYKDEITSYLNDIAKNVKEEHKFLEPYVSKKRSQLIRKYITTPSLPIEGGVVSKANKKTIQKLRREHLQQLLKRYRNPQTQISQHLDQFYLQKIKENWQKTREQQKQFQKYRQQINQFAREIGNGRNIDDIVEEVVLTHLDLVDPISTHPITDPIVLPDSKTLYDKSSVPGLLKHGKDPFTRKPFPSDIQFQSNQAIKTIIGSLHKDMKQITQSKEFSPKQKIMAMIRLRNRYYPHITQQKNK